jgi:hypothetical protein
MRSGGHLTGQTRFDDTPSERIFFFEKKKQKTFTSRPFHDAGQGL